MAAANLRRSLAGVAALGCALAAMPACASAAQLAGGARQAAIEHAFFAGHAHRGRIVTSVRISTANSAWSIVRYVAPPRASPHSPRIAKPRVRSAFYHLVGPRERAGHPPPGALSDLSHRFTVNVDYTGRGAESILDVAQTAGVCQGLGGFTDRETDSVSPMRWSVRYTVAPDELLAATRGPDGPQLVPRVTFARAASTLQATEQLNRSVIDLGCAGSTRRWLCTRVYRLSSGTDLLAISRAGLTIGVPKTATATGDCDAADFPVGPSQWAGNGTTALVKSLHLVAGTLPGDPYKPIAISWPRNSSQYAQGFGADPCASESTCRDTFRWTAKVTLAPGAGG